MATLVGDAAKGASCEQRGTVSSFDYGSVPSSVMKFLQSQAERIRRSCAKSIIQTGKDLIAAKHYLSHGAFRRWVESEIGIPARTAQAYMKVTQWASGKSATVAHLPPSVLYLLCAAGTPEEFTRDILRRVDAGQRVNVSQIRAELKVLRQTRQPERGASTTSLPWPPQTYRTTVSGPAAAEAGRSLMDVVDILAGSLSGVDFERVRVIMTSKDVLNDPKLAQNIVAAFSFAGAQTNPRHETSYAA
jgi:Protein of unknown function (DUF3102)